MARFAGWCDTCFCFRDIRRAVVAIGMFSMGTSSIQMLITIAVFTGANAMKPIEFEFDEPELDKSTTTYVLYIVLACLDLFVIIFSIILLYGNERTDEARARKHILPWLILMPFYVVYESGINIYYFYNQFNDLYEYQLKDASPAVGFHIVPLVYWVIKEVLMFICFLFLIVRYQSLRSHTIQYVEKIETGPVCNDYYAGPIMQAPVVLPAAPTCYISPGPAAPACTACSGGCAVNRCSKCNLVQPSYGYAAGPTANVGKSGWQTTIYSGGR